MGRRKGTLYRKSIPGGKGFVLECRASRKVAHRDVHAAEREAIRRARTRIRDGEISYRTYCYLCKHCQRLHLTRASGYEDRVNVLVHVPPSQHFQLSQMTPGARKIAHYRLEAERLR